MSEQPRSEKEEKRDDWEAFWRQDRVDSVGWATAFFWAALVLLAETTNLAANFSWWDGWGVFFAGAGVITLVATAIRLQMPEYRAKWVASLIFGLILLSIGLGGWEGWGWVWGLVLIAIGVITLRRAFASRR